MKLQRRSAPALLLLAAAFSTALGGCARFEAYRRADAERNRDCVLMCEQLLSRPALGLCDQAGICACFAPSQGWGAGQSAPMARIHSPEPVSVAGLTTRTQ